MNWIQEYNGTFFITITTIITGFLGLTIRYCLKSKCEDVSLCWGGFTIHRNVVLENPDIENNIENNNNEVMSNSTITTQPNDNNDNTM